mgnify:FL=1
MATVFFKITAEQEKEVLNLMKEEGYTNKAEFFRFLVKFYKYQKSPDLIRFEKAADDLTATLVKLDKAGKLTKSLDEQLREV